MASTAIFHAWGFWFHICAVTSIISRFACASHSASSKCPTYATILTWIWHARISIAVESIAFEITLASTLIESTQNRLALSILVANTAKLLLAWVHFCTSVSITVISRPTSTTISAIIPSHTSCIFITGDTVLPLAWITAINPA